MRILKLNGTKISPAKATAYFNKINNKFYYNLKHGYYRKKKDGGWVCNYCVDSSLGTPTDMKSVLILDRSDYDIMPVVKNGEVLLDKRGNIIYNIVIGNSDKNFILLWDADFLKNGIKCEYDFSGACEFLGSGMKSTDVYMPLLHIYGDCKLTTTCTDSELEKHKIIYEYDYKTDNWTHIVQG